MCSSICRAGPILILQPDLENWGVNLPKPSTSTVGSPGRHRISNGQRTIPQPVVQKSGTPQHVNLGHLASYLGITQETLNRIRANKPEFLTIVKEWVYAGAVLSSQTLCLMSLLAFIKGWNPKQVFLADALGALCTSLILAIILPRVHHVLGLEKSTLYFLASLALVFLVYSASMYLIRPRNWALFMKIIAMANFSYCVITWILLLSAKASGWAYLYFTGETLIVAVIARTEWAYAEQFQWRNFS